MEYGITKSIIDRLNSHEIEEIQNANLQFVWEVNYKNICGKKLLIIVHAQTRYCGVFTDIKRNSFKEFEKFLDECIFVMMDKVGFTKAEIEHYFQLSGQSVLTKTHGNNVCGGLKHITIELQYIEKQLVVGQYQYLISDMLNDEFVTNHFHGKEYFIPLETFKKEIRQIIN